MGQQTAQSLVNPVVYKLEQQVMQSPRPEVQPPPPVEVPLLPMGAVLLQVTAQQGLLPRLPPHLVLKKVQMQMR